MGANSETFCLLGPLKQQNLRAIKTTSPAQGEIWKFSVNPSVSIAVETSDQRMDANKKQTTAKRYLSFTRARCAVLPLDSVPSTRYDVTIGDSWIILRIPRRQEPDFPICGQCLISSFVPQVQCCWHPRGFISGSSGKSPSVSSSSSYSSSG